MKELIKEIKELVIKADGWMSDCDGNDHIADALTKLNELEAAMEPKPIESAPKGACIDVYSGGPVTTSTFFAIATKLCMEDLQAILEESDEPK